MAVIFRCAVPVSAWLPSRSVHRRRFLSCVTGKVPGFAIAVAAVVRTGKRLPVDVGRPADR
jgi:hypothetical protein